MRLTEYLSQQGIKRTEFAAKLDVSPGTITGWCKGTFWPSKENAKRIVEETGGAVSPNDFLETEDAA